jgi:hypothetical protein
MTTTSKRVLAVSAAVAAAGGAVVALPAQPANAHQTFLTMGDSTGGVWGEDHRDVGVCTYDAGYTAQVRYHTATSAAEYILGAPLWECNSERAPARITRWRLCLYPGGGCTGWKNA